MPRRNHDIACAKTWSCVLTLFSVAYTTSISGHQRALIDFLRMTTVTVVIAPSRLPLEGPCTCCMRERVARHRPGEGPKLSEMPRCLRALNLRPRAHEQSSVVASLLRN